MTAQSAKLFRNGGSQAVRLPAEFRFEGVDEVRIWRDPLTGDVVLSARKRTPEEFIKFRDSLGPLDAEDLEALDEMLRDRDKLRQKRVLFDDDASC